MREAWGGPLNTSQRTAHYGKRHSSQESAARGAALLLPYALCNVQRLCHTRKFELLVHSQRFGIKFASCRNTRHERGQKLTNSKGATHATSNQQDVWWCYSHDVSRLYSGDRSDSPPRRASTSRHPSSPKHAYDLYKSRYERVLH